MSVADVLGLVAVTVLVTGEAEDGRHVGFYRKAIPLVGFESYRQELVAFESELRAGEAVVNRGAAWTARLKKLMAAASARKA
jgi:hypothetical protein